MNVQVRHNGTNISGFVESYQREHKICTGVGTLQVVIVRTINRTFEPWDTIDIHENGDFKVRYYISSITDSLPKGTITLDCQDISKRLVDYFIPDSYTIETPSYTRFWIEKFLDEAGLEYTFTTSSQGNLISNNTQLGLKPAYEQILILLQMSGWFIYFDGNEKAVIGSLTTEKSSGGRSIGKTDIIEINRVSDDKMLRNRALVLGTFDPFTQSFASADITVHTRWNYDHRDVRAMVISNSNIPNKSSANGIANQLIKEFARITIEKHITVWGARNYNLGDSIKVTSNVWKGRGMITTFGTSMSKQGLVTHLILDERCPRLFGFFNFGDYVYVGTYGDGIWRKHIQFDPNWYDFSDGLTNLEITDLHINNGVFGSVGSQGEMYYTYEDADWSSITLTGLMSSMDDEVPSGMPVNYVPFSGLMARAVIIDKESNNLKYAVDTSSGINMGDYFMDWMTTTSGITSSGVLASGQMRSWIVEYDPFTGEPVGGLGSGVYPVHHSGNYAWSVVDLENDGYNDYISVAGGGTTVTHDDGYDFGYREAYPAIVASDENIRQGFSSLTYDEVGESRSISISTGGIINSERIIAVYNNELNGERDVVSLLGVPPSNITFKRIRLEKTISGFTDTSVTSPNQTGVGTLVLGFYKQSADIYKFFHVTLLDNPVAGVRKRLITKVRTWNADDNTVTGDTTLDTMDIAVDPLTGSSAGGHEDILVDSVTFNGKSYVCAVRGHQGDNGGFTSNIHNYVEIYRISVTLSTNAVTSGHITTFNYNDNSGTISPPHWLTHSIHSGTLTAPVPAFQFVFKKNNSPSVMFLVSEWNDSFSPSSLTNYMIHSADGENFSQTVVQTATSVSDEDFVLGVATLGFSHSQLTDSSYLAHFRDATGTKRVSYTYNGDTLFIRDETAGMPYYVAQATVYPMFHNIRNEYLAKNGSDWWWIDSATIQPVFQVSFPSGYTIHKPFSSSTKPLEQYLWFATRTADSRKVILKTQRAGALESVFDPASQPTFSTTDKAIIAGNWFIDISNFGPSLYLDNIFPPTEAGTYVVLQREGSDFNLIQQEAYPIRLDISNQSPLWTAGSGESSFTTTYVYDQEVQQITFISGLMSQQVNDFRYTYLEPASGSLLQTMGLYVTESGVLSADIETYSGGFQPLYEVPSGYGTRLETSNYGTGGQYIFVTASGDVNMFYQADPGEYFFDAFPGLPESRPTIIRLDDSM